MTTHPSRTDPSLSSSRLDRGSTQREVLLPYRREAARNHETQPCKSRHGRDHRCRARARPSDTEATTSHCRHRSVEAASGRATPRAARPQSAHAAGDLRGSSRGGRHQHPPKRPRSVGHTRPEPARPAARFDDTVSVRFQVYDGFDMLGYLLTDYSERWILPYGLGDMAVNDTRNFRDGYLSLGAVPFQTTSDVGVNDHLKADHHEGREEVRLQRDDDREQAELDSARRPTRSSRRTRRCGCRRTPSNRRTP